MGQSISYRDASKKLWATAETNSVGFPGLEAVNAGSLQRIADATEVMAKRYTDLMDDRDRYKKWYEEEQKRSRKLEKQLRAYRGVITRKEKLIKLLKDPMTKQPNDAGTDTTAAGAATTTT